MKSIFLILVIILMVFNLFGCSNNKETPTSQISTQQQDLPIQQQIVQEKKGQGSYDTSHFKVELSYPNDDRSQQSLNMAAERELKRADDTLNEIYNKVLIKYKEDNDFINKFTNAELAWITFRDAEFEAIYPAKDKQREYGSIYPMVLSVEKATFTWDRVKQLNQWLEGFPEGQSGAGSRGIKHHDS